MPCDDCVSRRRFLASAGGAAALAALTTACGDGVVSPVGPGFTDVRLDPPVVISVASFPGLATVGTLVKVADVVAAKRTGPGSFDAFNMTCTHQGCLTTIVSGQRFDCPCHGSQFDAGGAVVRSPARRPLQRFTTSYDASTDTLTIS